MWGTREFPTTGLHIRCCSTEHQIEFKLQNIMQKWKQMQYLCTTVTPYKKNGQECFIQASTCENMVFVSWRLQVTIAFWKCSIPGATLSWKSDLLVQLYLTVLSFCLLEFDVTKDQSSHFQLWHFASFHSKTTNQSGRVTSLQTHTPSPLPDTLAWPFPRREAEPMWVGPLLLTFFQ